MEKCPCGTGLKFDECCDPIIKGDKLAETAEQVMRSRYTAYVKHETEYLYTSIHPDERGDYDEKSTKKWAEGYEWHGLEIVNTFAGGAGDTDGRVEFVATYSSEAGKQDHHEMATFKKEQDSWYFVNGAAVPPRQFVREGKKVGRNDPCPCGSGKKFKKCCA